LPFNSFLVLIRASLEVKEKRNPPHSILIMTIGMFGEQVKAGPAGKGFARLRRPAFNTMKSRVFLLGDSL
jgi:hypothetical protein